MTKSTRVVLCGAALFWNFTSRAQGQAAASPPTQAAAKSPAPSVAGYSVPVAPLPEGNKAVDEMNLKYIKVWRTLMAPKNVADSFGRRIATRYIAMQLTIANRNTEYQWLIQDASINLEKLLLHLNEAVPNKSECAGNLTHLLKSLHELGITIPSSRTPFRYQDEEEGGSSASVSSADLTVLRGVAEKGQVIDPRNLTLRLMTGAGTVAAGLIGVARFGPSFAPGVAAFNGPLLAAYQTIFPDFTVNQLNRLNDSAFLANTVIDKQQARVIVIFVPMDYLLTKAQAKKFYADPESVFGCPDLRLLEASVNGNFVTTLLPTPAIASISINANEEANFGRDDFKVKGSVTGRFLERAKIALVAPPDGVTVTLDGEPLESQLSFLLEGKKPILPGQALEFQVSVDGTQPAKSTLKVLYQPAKPTLHASALDPAAIAPGTTRTVTIKGGSFLPGMQVLIEPSADIKVGPLEYVSNGEVKVDLSVDASAVEGQRQLRLSSAGGLTDPATTVTIKK